MTQAGSCWFLTCGPFDFRTGGRFRFHQNSRSFSQDRVCVQREQRCEGSRVGQHWSVAVLFLFDYLTSLMSFCFHLCCHFKCSVFLFPLFSLLTHTPNTAPLWQTPSWGKPSPLPPSKDTTLSRLCWCCSDSSRCVCAARVQQNSTSPAMWLMCVACLTLPALSRARTRWSPCRWFLVTSTHWSTWCDKTTSPRRTSPCCRLSCPGKAVSTTRQLVTGWYRTSSESPQKWSSHNCCSCCTARWLHAAGGFGFVLLEQQQEWQVVMFHLARKLLRV